MADPIHEFLDVFNMFCIKVPNIFTICSYLEKLLDVNSIRMQSAARLFESVAKNEVGTEIAFDFLRKNWNELINQ